MIKRPIAQLFLIASLALLAACSSHAPSSSRNTATLISPSNGSSFAPPSRTSSKLVGLVANVTDGDTIEVIDEQRVSYRIRLQGIDAPERQQAFSNVARRNLITLVAGKTVLVEWQKHDQYGRLVGKVLSDNRDVCLAQIRAGLAWHYKEFEDEQSEVDRRSYAEAEQLARSKKLGLWRDAFQIEPWEFRHHKPANSTEAEYQAGKQSSRPSGLAETEISIRGNRNSKIYHWPGCPNYDDIAPHNRVPFRTREEAERAGYRAARNCP